MFVAAIEAAAQRIGLTVDNTWEALLYIMFKSRAAQYACEISEYAADVFNVSQAGCPFL